MRHLFTIDTHDYDPNGTREVRPSVRGIILREREIVHFQRFGEAIELLRRKLNQRNVYSMNPAIDL